MPVPFIRSLHQPNLDELHALPTKVAAARQRHADRLQQIDRDPTLSADGRQRAIAANRAELQRVVAPLQARRDELQTTLRAAGDFRSPTQAGDAVSEQRKAAAWRRYSEQLAAGAAVDELLDQVRASGDVDAVAALREELPTHLRVQATKGKTGLEAATALKEVAEQRRQIDAQLDVIEGSGSGDSAGRAQLRALPSGLLAKLDTELDGARLDAQGHSPAGERRMVEAYATGEAETLTAATEQAFTETNTAE